MDEEGDWITARYLLSTILGRNPLVVDYVDEETFPVDRSTRRATPSPVTPPPAVKATEDVAGTVCTVCTEEIALADTVMWLPCSHCYHAGCISPWLGIKNTCPMCRAELPKEADDGNGTSREKPRARAGAGASSVRREASYEFLTSTILSS